jgi:hypothetical protein
MGVVPVWESISFCMNLGTFAMVYSEKEFGDTISCMVRHRTCANAKRPTAPCVLFNLHDAVEFVSARTACLFGFNGYTVKGCTLAKPRSEHDFADFVASNILH